MAIIRASHGIEGCVSAESLSDNPLRFQAGAAFSLKNGKSLTLEKDAAWHKGRLLLKFQEVNDRNAADQLRGQALYVPESSVPPLPEGSWYHFQLIGLKVWEGDTYLGEIQDVLAYTANDVYVVKGDDGKEILLPALKSVVKQVDLQAKRMEVTVPEGLI